MQPRDHIKGYEHRHERKCIVCGEPAHLFSPDSAPVCLRAECIHVVGKKQHMNKAAGKQYFSLQSAQIKWNIKHSALKKKRMGEKKKKEHHENVFYWIKAIKYLHGYDLEQYPYTVISTNAQRICKLPKHRRKLYREFLSDLIHETILETEGCSDNRDEENLRHETGDNGFYFEAKACSLCMGGCCCIGEEHAFLKKETILRYLSGNPHQKPEEVLDAYMAYLPEKTFEDSCVNHKETGCSLPRNMRSHVCNDYACDSLDRLRIFFNREVALKGVFFIRRKQNNWTKDELDADNRIVSSELIVND